MTTLERPATGASEVVDAALRPYKGLDFYSASEEDARFFVGRDTERKLIASNLIASRLTVVYGASGVGKSSLLNAGVAYRLRADAERDERGVPEYAVVVYAAWRDDPLQGLVDAVASEVKSVLGDHADLPPPGGTLAATLREWSAMLDGELLIVLDQFEEFFLYHGDETRDSGFAAQFADAINDPAVHANFLVSIREDALGRLDLFKDRIPNLFENCLRLDHLGVDAGREAIERPLQEWNDLVDADEPVSIEPALVEEVLRQVRTVEIAGEGLGSVDATTSGSARARVEAPYLQIVLIRIWRTEREKGSNVLRLSTLRELGGAQKIVDERVRRAMDALDPEEQAVAAGVCHYLVSKTGTKIAFSASDLAGFSGLPEDEVADVLEQLTHQNARILRPIAPPTDHPGDTRYELFHDKLATAILEWRAGFLERQARIEAEQQLEAEQAERQREVRNTIVRWAAIALLAVVVALVALSVVAVDQWRAAGHARDEAESRYFASQADGALDAHPRAALRLAALGVDKSMTDEAVRAFRETLQAAHLRFQLRGHKRAVITTAFNRQGTRILTASIDGTVRTWNAADGRQIRAIPVGRGPYMSASVSPDGGHVAVTRGGPSVVVWNVGDGRRDALLHLPSAAYSAQYSPDGEHVAVLGAFAGARLWDPSTGRALALGSHGVQLLTAAFSPDGRLLVAGDGSGGASLWDTSTGKQLRRLFGHGGVIYLTGFSPDGKRVVTASGIGTVRVWDVASGRLLSTFVTSPGRRGSSAVYVARFSPDGHRLLTAGEHGVRVWDTRRGTNVATLLGITGAVYTASFSPDGREIVTGGADRTARLWDASTGKLLALLGEAVGPIYDARFSGDGQSVATAGAAGTATMWNVSTVPRLAVLRGPEFSLASAVFNPEGTRVVTAKRDGTVRVWPVAGGRGRETLRGGGQPQLAATSTRDGDRVVAVSADGTVRVWPAGGGHRPKVFKPHGDHFFASASFSPDGTRFVAVSGDAATVSDVDGGRVVATLRTPGKTITAARFDAEGARVVTAGGDGTARVWSVPDGKPLATFTSPRPTAAAGLLVAAQPTAASLNDASFSPDGRLLVTASSDGTARVWDVGARKRIATLTGHANAVLSAAFNRDGTVLVTTGADGTTRIWDASSYQPLAVLAGGGGQVLRADFSPDGLIVTTGSDGSARLYACRFCESRTALKTLAHTMVDQR